MSVMSAAVYILCVVLALLAVYYVVKGFAADLVLLGVCAVLLLTWGVEGVVLTVKDLGTAGPVAPDRITLYGYLATGLALPLGAGWLGVTERSTWGSAAILAVALTQIVLQMRLPQLWPGGFA